jgi:hypothetical protein
MRPQYAIFLQSRLSRESGCGTYETSTDVRYTAAFAGKADISQRLPDDRDL